jgi:hypothetical protein
MHNMTDEEINERWEERAAIREYLGGFSRLRAEYLAAKDVKEIAGRVTDEILKRIAGNDGKKD